MIVKIFNKNRKLIIRIALSVFICGVCLSPGSVQCQNLKTQTYYDRTLLQVSSGFYTVEKNATVDLDSSLLITSQWHRISRVPVITEGIDGSYTAQNCRWMDKNNTDSVRKKLAKLKGTDQARLALLIGAYYAFHPAFETKYIDSSIFYLTLAKKMCSNLHLSEWSLQCSCLLGKCYFKRNDISAGKIWFKTITDHTKEIADQKIVAKAWNYEGMYCPFLANTTNFRLDCLRKALASYKDLKDTSNQANTLMNIAYLSFANRQIRDAEDAANASLSLQKAMHFTYTQYTYDLLAYLALVKSDYSKQLNLALNAVNAAEINKDNMALGHFYLRVAYSYQLLHGDEEGVKWEKKALKKFEEQSSSLDIYILLADIEANGTEIEEGPDYLKFLETVIKKDPPTNPTEQQSAYIALARGYELRKSFKNAEKYYLKADSLEKFNLMSKGGVTNFLLIFSMGQFYLETKDYKKSKTYYIKLLDSAYKTTTPKGMLMDAYYALHVIDSAAGNYLSSLNYLHQYSDLHESIFSEKQSKQLTALNVKYETAQKVKDLQILKAQNQLEIQRAGTTKKITYSAIVVLLLIIGAVYNRYHSNKKNNKLLQTQKAEINEQNHSLQILNQKQTALLTEKELLLREIHHRVKNNLQTTMSLLNMQSAYISNDAALEAIKSSQRRMHAMSLIHQQLYQSDKVTDIDMLIYIKELVNSLKESFTGMNNINFNLHVEPVKLDAAEAVPLGLIVNEAVTNVIKHAFPDHKKGQVDIILTQENDSVYILTIKDNGIGISDSFEVYSGNSLGMNLMKGLAGQLAGDLSVENDNGTTLTCTFIITKATEEEEAVA